MSKNYYNVSDEYRPVSAWGYVGYTFLFAIPVVGLILLIVFSFSTRNYNRRNFARSYFCWLLIAVIVLVGSMLLSGNLYVLLNEGRRYIDNTVDQIKAIISTFQEKNKTVIPSGNVINQPASDEFRSNPEQNKTTGASSSAKSKDEKAMNASSANQITLREGKYIIGKDINVGNYIITCTGTAGEAAGKAYGSVGNMMDSLDGNSNGEWGNLYGSLGNLMGEYIDMTVEILGDYGDVLRSFTMKNGDSRTIKLEKGTALNITDGSCTLTLK